MTPSFTVKIYRGGVRKPSAVEFHTCVTPRVIDLTNETNKFEQDQYKQFIEKGATHAVDVIVNDRADQLFLFKADAMFIESPDGGTIYSINRKT